jgi:hypothetical protein
VAREATDEVECSSAVERNSGVSSRPRLNGTQGIASSVVSLYHLQYIMWTCCVFENCNLHKAQIEIVSKTLFFNTIFHQRIMISAQLPNLLTTQFFPILSRA